jgi:hypothetical protein
VQSLIPYVLYYRKELIKYQVIFKNHPQLPQPLRLKTRHAHFLMMQAVSTAAILSAQTRFARDESKPLHTLMPVGHACRRLRLCLAKLYACTSELAACR